jgi:hypothetical protein
LRKEIIIKIIIEGDKIGSIIHKSGFNDDISSKFEVIGILRKIISDEQLKLDNKLKVEKNFIIKESLDNDDINNKDAI